MGETAFMCEQLGGEVMSNRIGAISVELAKRLNIEPVKALQLFYESQTSADLHDKSTGLYLYGDLYVAEVEREGGRGGYLKINKMRNYESAFQNISSS